MSSPEQVFTKVLATLIAETEKVVMLRPNIPVIVAIDGNCGSGKTLYGNRLATFFSANLIHCDDFFLPKDMRTAERLSEVGGNIHYERLRALLARIRTEQPSVTGKRKNVLFTYRAYNCSTDSYEERPFYRSNVVVVEGSYALHPMLTEFYDLKIVLKTDAQTQLERLTAREGGRGITDFVSKWIPLENRYLATLDTSDCIVIKT